MDAAVELTGMYSQRVLNWPCQSYDRGHTHYILRCSGSALKIPYTFLAMDSLMLPMHGCIREVILGKCIPLWMGTI
ncbi:MAG: hypothetical protein ACC707_19305, partial [Thiohalomonadales bacterium]